MFTHFLAAYSLLDGGAKTANQSSPCHDSLSIREKLELTMSMTEDKGPGKLLRQCSV
jgi:hypothetical protein